MLPLPLRLLLLLLLSSNKRTLFLPLVLSLQANSVLPSYTKGNTLVHCSSGMFSQWSCGGADWVTHFWAT